MKTIVLDDIHKPEHDRFTRFLATVLIAVGLVASSTEKTAAQERDSSPRSIPPNAHYDGFTYALGTYTPSVADGYALILAPLPVGEHTIHEHIVIPAFNAVADNTFHFHVVPASR